MRRIILLNTALIFVFCSLLTIAQNTTFDVEGSAIIQGENIGRARKEAIKNALSRAVELATATVLSASVFENNYDILDKRILLNADVYVTNQVLISESREAERYRVIVRVGVNMDKLRADLISAGLLLPKEKIPLWLVVVPERGSDGQWRSKWSDKVVAPSSAETAIEDVLLEYGFRVVTKNSQTKLITFDEIEKTASATEKFFSGETALPSSLIKYAANAGAGYLIFGKVQTTLGEGISGGGSKLAIADIQLVEVDVAAEKVIGKFSITNAMEALQVEGLEARTIKLGISKIKADIYKTLDTVNPAGSPAGFPEVTISLSGIKSFKQYIAITDFLESGVRGVRGVEIVKVSPTEIVLKVKITGKAESLLSSLLANKFADFTLQDGGKIEEVRKIIVLEKTF